MSFRVVHGYRLLCEYTQFNIREKVCEVRGLWCVTLHHCVEYRRPEKTVKTNKKIRYESKTGVTFAFAVSPFNPQTHHRDW